MTAGTFSMEEFRQLQDQRNAALGILEHEQLEQATYPTFFTATFDYGATGEGRTQGVSMHYARSYQHLCGLIDQDFGGFYVKCSEVALGLVLLPVSEVLLPNMIIDIVKAFNRDAPGVPFDFSFTATFHQNYA